MKKRYTLWHIPADGSQEGTKLLGEFPAHGKAIMGAQPFIPEGFTPAAPWNKEGNESRLDMGEYGMLLVVGA